MDFHVIDDNGTIVEFTIAALESEGYTCRGFTSPDIARAIQHCVEFGPSQKNVGCRSLGDSGQFTTDLSCLLERQADK